MGVRELGKGRVLLNCFANALVAFLTLSKEVNWLQQLKTKFSDPCVAKLINKKACSAFNVKAGPASKSFILFLDANVIISILSQSTNLFVLSYVPEQRIKGWGRGEDFQNGSPL